VAGSAAHRLDTARLYRLALEKADAGDKFHAVAEEECPSETSLRPSAAA
jgi:hypothetical protein